LANEEENTLDTIRDLKRKDPFVPFRVVMTSGDGYLIEDPDALAIATSQLHYYPPRSGVAIHMRLNQIASVEEDGEKPPARRRKSA
jgi:hypothetical protein